MNDRNEEETMLLLHKLIYQALIEIREEATIIDNRRILKLSDLMHNLPLKLAKSDCDHKLILKNLMDHAESIGSGRWLENAIKQL